MTAHSQLFSGLGTAGMGAGPWPFALATFQAESTFALANVPHRYRLQYVGTGRIAGTVKVIDVAAPSRRVRLYDKVSGTLARQTLSDGGGLYAFENIDALRTYYVIAEDAGSTPYNATIEDFVVPA